MPDNDEISPGSTSSSADGSGTFLRPREVDLDRDRIASMADEGGVAAAVADLRDQLETMETGLIPIAAPPLAAGSFARVRWSTLMWSALALGAVGFLAGIALRYRR
jgi:hypothetical protein